MRTLTKIALVLIPTITLSMMATAHDSMHVKKQKRLIVVKWTTVKWI